MLNVLTTKNKAKAKQNKRDTRKLWMLLDISIILIVVMVSWVFALQTSNYTLNMCSSLYIDYTS